MPRMRSAARRGKRVDITMRIFGLEFGDREESSGMCDTGVGRPQTAGAVWKAGWCKAVLAENVSERPRSTGQRGVREGACCLVLAR